MALPVEIAVRISSEAGGAITLTPVVSQNMPVRDLVEVILSTTGKDPSRVSDVLARGAVVQGASRFRWQGFEAAGGDLSALLAAFPDPDPSRPFRPEACIGVRLRAGLHVIELPREIASETRLLKRHSFWDTLMEVVRVIPPAYVDYSYKLRSDQYRLALNSAGLTALRIGAERLRYPGLAAQIRTLPFEFIELAVRFP